MPELPEVEVIKNELTPLLKNQKIKKISSLWYKTFVNLCGVLPDNKIIIGSKRIGKYIILLLEENYIVIHLRMTGQLIYYEDKKYSKDYLRAVIHFHSGSVLNFYDLRKFGRIYHVCDLNSYLSRVGIDALDKKFTKKYFNNLMLSKKQRIKSLLLDQKYIAGLGNIYIDESLFLSGIHPKTSSNEINSHKRELLYKNIQKVLNFAIKNMGTTISNYRTSGGGFGTNQNYLKVYGRGGKPCFNCNSKIEKIRINSRGTHFCPTCQTQNGVLK